MLYSNFDREFICIIEPMCCQNTVAIQWLTTYYILMIRLLLSKIITRQWGELLIRDKMAAQYSLAIYIVTASICGNELSDFLAERCRHYFTHKIESG